MDSESDLNPDTDDLPLCANTNHILVKHYVLDLTVCFERKVISGSIVLFLDPCSGSTEKDVREKTCSESSSASMDPEVESREGSVKKHDDMEKLSRSWELSNDGDFTLVLDCCDLAVSKVEEVDVSHVSDIGSEKAGVSSLTQNATLVQNILSMPSTRWRQQHQMFSLCSRAPGVQGDSSLRFHTNRWSLQVRKRHVSSSQDFPRVLRVFYETRPEGGSVRWTRDQDDRACVYTAGSPINNRALFPCQEPPVAMSTWQAIVRAPSDCVVLMSGEEAVKPTEDSDCLIWNYYVTMPMPASTFALAVGHWRQVTDENSPTLEKESGNRLHCGTGENFGAETSALSTLGNSTRGEVKVSTLQPGRGHQTSRSPPLSSHPSLEEKTSHCSAVVDDSIPCSHGDYPCRVAESSVRSQQVIPHRVFAPDSLLHKAQIGILSLLPKCLEAAFEVLGVHPFSRLDVLVVPAGFSSLGMASPHIVFLSQSVLNAGGSGSGEKAVALCGSRLCHEIAHSWFGLVIGARDWTEEWISEGFATYLEDVIWARAQQLSFEDAAEQSSLKALLRWRRLSDELQNSQEELQILRPNMERTGQVSDSGSSTVKHALNPDKSFMQVHYLKGYFLLRFLASQVGEQQFINFFRLFVQRYHGQLILSQDFLHMLLITFPDIERRGLTLSAIYADWLDRPGIPEWLYERSAVWSQTRLVEEVKAEVVKWILPSHRHQGKGRKRKQSEPKVKHKEVTSDQLVLLLEFLLEEARLSAAKMRALAQTYALQNQDAEVRHRWCELVVKHGFSEAYGDLEHFLVHDQAMGVYLYGELMVHEDSEQQELARRCLSRVSAEMDRSARKVVEEMVL
ncbi:aminopeptidase O isoform X1 [Synchiropus splendidus]|uniref:aminopeptidase O isoform X1 n=2 Tax=Synchiropus splendidus TaxID=270530 RepID=UPI00237E9638|nr:aminopeptidase O isoform X1 [Synchiropus splendidus]XP_053725537.1 aminopeptidase O isoform X1 [Synchiropus splendidus]